MVFQGEERRKHVRVFLSDGQVRLVSGMLIALVGKVVDISLGGLKFTCSAEFKVDDELDMEVTLPNGMKLKTPFRVTHLEMAAGKKDKLVYGGTFTSLSDDQKLELGEFVMRTRAEQDSILKDKIE
jgi:PilZ domain.